MKIMFAIIMLLFFSCDIFAEELFVNYLKPVNKKQQETKKKQSRRDPLQEPMPFSVKNEKFLVEKMFNLKAILYNPNSKKAYINDDLYTEGDQIDGYKVKAIFVDYVILSKGNKDYILKLD